VNEKQSLIGKHEQSEGREMHWSFHRQEENPTCGRRIATGELLLLYSKERGEYQKAVEKMGVTERRR